MKIHFTCLSAALCGVVALNGAQPLTESKFTEVVNKVAIVEANGSAKKSATVNGLFKSPDLIQTGSQSRAELVAADQTVTRVGANTVFSFQSSGRGVNLEKGSILFHSPSGKGGGQIKTASATASVLGTTIIVTATLNGGFKFLVLEGKGKAVLSNGRSMTVKAGQMTFVVPGMTQLPSPIEFRLSSLTGGSGLIKGFSNPVSSQDKIDKATQEQEKDIAGGKAEDTNLLVGEGTADGFQVIDPNVRETFLSDNTSKILAALATDRVITLGRLGANDVFAGTLALERQFGSEQTGNIHFDVLIGRNITFKTSQLSLDNFAKNEFIFLAGNDLLVPQSISVRNFRGTLVFQALNNVDISSGVSFYVYDAKTFEIQAGKNVTISGPNTSIVAYNGELKIIAGEKINITGVVNLNAVSKINMEADTIVLQNVNLFSNTQVRTRTGNWSSSAPVAGGTYFNNVTIPGTAGTRLVSGSGGQGTVATSGPGSDLYTITSNTR
ncbi:MAG: FecR family protein [Verrucomicrobiota bacterium]|nr:FecR family protein [Verrucomicrobiota bacterium]